MAFPMRRRLGGHARQKWGVCSLGFRSPVGVSAEVKELNSLVDVAVSEFEVLLTLSADAACRSLKMPNEFLK